MVEKRSWADRGRSRDSRASAHLNHRRIVSHARPKKFAPGTSASAMSGNSASGLPSSSTLTVPTRCPLATGASSGSGASIASARFPALPFGTMRYWSARNPAATSAHAPFHTRSVDTRLAGLIELRPCRTTGNPNSAASAPRSRAPHPMPRPSTTASSRRSPRLADAIRHHPAASVCPVFTPSTYGSVQSRRLRFGCVMLL